jgi:hypothetical protein
VWLVAGNGRGGEVYVEDPVLALTGVGKAAESAGGEEALRQPFELDAAMLWAWIRGAKGGVGHNVERWYS